MPVDNAQANEIKKEYLKGYLTSTRRVKRITEEIAQLRLMKMSPSAPQSEGMPKGSNGTGDLSGYAAKLDNMISELQDEREKCILKYQEIVGQIKKLKNENELDVLFYRYVVGLDWWEISDKMKYAERHVHRIHGRALLHFELPKHVIVCQ